MNRNGIRTAILAALLLATVAAGPVEAQKSWLKKTIEDAVKDETRRQADRAVRGAIRCAVGEYECFENAKKQGKEVVYVDDAGQVITDNQGDAVTDPNNLPAQYQNTQYASAPPAAAPPPAAAVAVGTFDFEAGGREIFYEDYSADIPGDFPRRLELVAGNWDLVDYAGKRMLRNTGPRHSAFKVPLPETLPQQFTIEMEVLLTKGNANLALSTAPPLEGRKRLAHSDFNYFDIGSWGTGVTSRDQTDVTASEDVDNELVMAPVPIRIMADGSHVKMYVGENRVANVPNADLRRTNSLWIENTYAASEQRPILIGSLRVAAGGRDLYDALATDGRVAVHDILFDIDQATIKPESTEVLNRIGGMLTEHPEMSLLIEGHTDASGDFDHNMALSQGRADSVKQWLEANHGIAPDRLRTMGLGSTQPKQSNDTEDGMRQNRRVELVKIG